MISAFREFTKSIVFKILMALLILSFAVFGMNDLFSTSNSANAIEAGPRQTSAQDYRRAFDNYKADAEQRAGRPIPYEEAVEQGLHLRVLEDLAGLDSLYSWLNQAGIKPSSKLVVEQISQVPNFFDSITGRFDRAKYQSVLQQENFTEAKFEQIISDDIASRQFIEAAVAGLKPPRIYTAMQGAFGLETRNAAFLIITPDSVEQPGEPTQAELQKFYNENQERMRSPELRQFAFVTFAPADFAAKVSVDEAELKKLYEFRRDTLSQPETRSFVQITVPDQAAAQKVSAALKAGQDPQAVAKANKGTVVVFDAKPKTAVPDRKVADAAFALKEGEVSGAVQGELSVAVIRMGKVTAGSVPSYEAVREGLVQEYTIDEAKDLTYTAVEAFEKDRATGTDFLAAAQKAGARVANLPPMTAEGQMVNGQSFAELPQVIKVAFDQPKGGESDVTELEGGAYFAVRVNEVIPAQVPPLDKVRTELIQVWKARAVADRVVAKGDEVSARLRKGETLEAVAASMNVKLETMDGLERNSAAQKVGPELAGRVFSAKSGEVFQARANEQVTVVGVLKTINKPDAATVNQASAMSRQSLTAGIFEDLSATTRSGARTLMKTKTYPQTAVRALGLTPEDPKAVPADDAKDAK